MTVVPDARQEGFSSFSKGIMGRKRTRANKRLALTRHREPAFVPKPGPGQHFIVKGSAVPHHVNVNEHPLTAEYEAGQERVERVTRIAKRRGIGGDHPLLKAYRAHQITTELYEAGYTFRILFQTMHKTGKDSTQALLAGGSQGGGSPAPFTQQQVDAIRTIEKLEKEMAPRDYYIVRRLCGEGHTMAQAVKAVTRCHASGVKYRVIEALEELHRAMDKLRVRRLA